MQSPKRLGNDVSGQVLSIGNRGKNAKYGRSHHEGKENDPAEPDHKREDPEKTEDIHSRPAPPPSPRSPPTACLLVLSSSALTNSARRRRHGGRRPARPTS